MRSFIYVEPETIEEACEFLGIHGEDTKILAGGCSLSILLKQKLIEPQYILSLERLPNLQEVVHKDGKLMIGARVTHRVLELARGLPEVPPLLRQMAACVGQVQVRNLGTIGGNLCHAESRSDPPAALVALDSSVVLQSRDATRCIKVEEFITDYYTTEIGSDEILTQIMVPDLPPKARCEYVKLTPHSGMAEPLATLATVFVPGARQQPAELRVVLGAVSPGPLRLRDAENMVCADGMSDVSIDRAALMAAEASDPLDDSSGSAEWKREVVRVHVARLLKRMRDTEL